MCTLQWLEVLRGFMFRVASCFVIQVSCFKCQVSSTMFHIFGCCVFMMWVVMFRVSLLEWFDILFLPSP